MKGTELQTWARFHGDRFPDWAAWWQGLDVAAKNSMAADAGDTLVTDLQEASRRYCAVPRAQRAFRHEDVLYDVLELAKAVRVDRWKADDSQRGCGMCRGGGLVEVFLIETALGRRARASVQLQPTAVAFVACLCDAGANFRINGVKRKEKLAPIEAYNHAVHVRVEEEPWRRDGQTREDWDASRAAMDARVAEVGRSQAFAESFGRFSAGTQEEVEAERLKVTAQRAKLAAQVAEIEHAAAGPRTREQVYAGNEEALGL